MNRCHAPKLDPAARLLAGALLASLFLLGPLPAQAQAQQASASPVREFPKAALRGVLVVTSPPDVKLDGQADRLSPGARIRGPQNGLLLSGSLVGQELLVNYLRDGAGLISQVWVLTPDEAKEKRAGARAARNFLFQSEVDTTPRDDGKTPFNQLPKYPQQ
jgi:hypothetical protein